MDKNTLAQKLKATFLVELGEHVESMNREFMALEKDPPAEERKELLKQLFRSIHTLKGAARAVMIERIEEACHAVEDILDAARDGRQSISADLYPLLFQFVDAIEEAGMRLREEQDLTGSPLQTLLPQLRQAAIGDDATDRGAEANPMETDAADAVEPAPLPAHAVTEPSPKESDDPGSERPAEETAAPSVAAAKSAASNAPRKSKHAASQDAIRVSADKLDSMMAQSGELLVARQRLEYRSNDAASLQESIALLRAEWRELDAPIRKSFSEGKNSAAKAAPFLTELPPRAAAVLQKTGVRLAQLEKKAERLAAGMAADGRLMGQTCDALDNDVRRVRMLPFAEACGGLARAVRDIAHAEGKHVELVLQGEDVEMDRSVLEGLKDPLLHLVRNAIDHGIESPETRASHGKPATGQVVVSAALRGAHVEVVVADDGSGVNLAAIREMAQKRGLAVPKDERELVRMLFLPGFSTAATITDVSGRGVGLDVVESRIQSLHGTVGVSFEVGLGTRFTLTVPLTLTTIRCVFVTVGGQIYAIPTASIRQLVRFDSANIRSVSGRDVLLLGGVPTPLRALADTLGCGDLETKSPTGKRLGVVLVSGDQDVAFLVDEVNSEHEVLVKSLGPRIRRLRLVSGASLLPSGKVALVLNPGSLVRTAMGQSTTCGMASDLQTQAAVKRQLLLVEDSMTTRALMKNILESAGYSVLTAADGQQAWQLLQEQPFDLVVSDVDMPRMNGFELAEAVHNASDMGELPVILVTARETDEDKTRGLQVGASAYLLKSSFDQTNLLETIQQLL